MISKICRLSPVFHRRFEVAFCKFAAFQLSCETAVCTREFKHDRMPPVDLLNLIFHDEVTVAVRRAVTGLPATYSGRKATILKGFQSRPCTTESAVLCISAGSAWLSYAQLQLTPPAICSVAFAGNLLKVFIGLRPKWVQGLSTKNFLLQYWHTAGVPTSLAAQRARSTSLQHPRGDAILCL